MKLHPRHVPTCQAEGELAMFMISLRVKYTLTASEELQLYATFLRRLAKGCVREERRIADGEPNEEQR